MDAVDPAIWQSRKVVVLGDVMLDRFIYGQVERISPESPIPILRYAHEVEMLGGAGNVARNVVSLGGRAVLVGAVGADDAGDAIAHRLAPQQRIETAFISPPDYRTTVKSRYVASGQQMLRLDIEQALAESPSRDADLLGLVEESLRDADALILSDYAKGVLSPRLVGDAIAAAARRAIPIVVDPKQRDFTLYRGATVVTPNAGEAADATGLDTSGDAGAEAAARAIQHATGLGAVLLTRGQRGMTVLPAPHDAAEAGVTHITTVASEVFDVSGAGDTVAAALALALSAGLPLVEGARLANVAAGIAVGKQGTAAVSAAELLHRLHGMAIADLDHKILVREAACDRARQWRRDGCTIGFTNGCFDLMHPGHVALLRSARKACDRLIVGLNSDESVALLKGPKRPVQTEIARAIVMASIGAVDLVTIFEEDTPLGLITALRPDILFKGADYALADVVGGDLVRSYGGRVELVPLQVGHSTTALIARGAQ